MLLTLPAVLNKSDIGPVFQLKGALVSGVVTIGGAIYDTETLRFVGFAGGRSDDGFYVGHYRFERADGTEQDLIELADLPQRTTADAEEENGT